MGWKEQCINEVLLVRCINDDYNGLPFQPNEKQSKVGLDCARSPSRPTKMGRTAASQIINLAHLYIHQLMFITFSNFFSPIFVQQSERSSKVIGKRSKLELPLFFFSFFNSSLILWPPCICILRKQNQERWSELWIIFALIVFPPLNMLVFVRLFYRCCAETESLKLLRTRWPPLIMKLVSVIRLLR